jgi:hypothetical protein
MKNESVSWDELKQMTIRALEGKEVWKSSKEVTE